MQVRSVQCVIITVMLLTAIGSNRASAQLSETTAFLADLQNQYRVLPDVTYHIANGHENKLDLYLPRNTDIATPVLMFFHGGGWVAGVKDSHQLWFLPYLEMGWAVVNVGYRLGEVSRAPAAVEDCLCALRWVSRNAERYNLDTSRIVTTGNSAGGHLALTTGMIPSSTGLDLECAELSFAGPPKADPVRVAAVINWYGVTDVVELLEGPNAKGYAIQWLGSFGNRIDIAKRVSPLTYIRRDLPAILTIHGDADPIVPYQHAVRLREGLNSVEVPNYLHTVRGGGHGGFSTKETIAIYEMIQRFLGQHVLEDFGSISP